MKQYLLATISSLALVGTAAAADMPIYPVKAPMGAALAPSWTGPYYGLNGGIAWHRASVNSTGAIPFSSASVRATGGTFGGQIGYNWQLDEKFVTGLEADWNWVGGSKSTTAADGTVFSSRLSWLATFRARAGITLSPTLLYVTGGLAVGKVKNDADIFGGGVDFINNHQTRTGWTVGAGIEHMFGHNWTAKAEVLYVDLGDKTASERGGSSYTGRFKNTAVIGRVGINLKW